MNLTAADRFGVVLLAAGASSRMGTPKLLLPWHGRSILSHLIGQWHELGADHIAVVHAAGHAALAAELDRLQFPASHRISNPQPGRGMFSSIQCAARWPGWKPGLARWAIILGDQPHLRSATLRQLLRFAAAHPPAICQPAARGRPKHPVLLPEPAFRQLASSPADTLRQFLASAAVEIKLCESDDPGLDLDLDEPADYEQALRLRAEA